MTDQAERAAARRLELALDMFETGEALMRAKLRRDHPNAEPSELQARLDAWLMKRPHAPALDASITDGAAPS